MQNIKTNFFLTCEVALLDKGENLSLINIFENINSATLPAIFPKFSVAVNFTVIKPMQLVCQILIKDLEGTNIINSGESTLKTDIENKKVQFLTSFNNLPFLKEGDYPIYLLVNGEIISETVLHIKKI